MIAWIGYTANPDSAMHESAAGKFQFQTQEDRGAMYKRQAQSLFSHRAPDGTFPVVGLSWWEYMDKAGERANWGLVSVRDNAYDGNEAVAAAGKDSWGYPTGGEDKNYGNFVSAVRTTNLSIMESLRDEISSALKEKVQHSGR